MSDQENSILTAVPGVIDIPRRLPPSFQAAKERGVTPVDDHHLEIGLSFELANGEIIRLRLGVEGVRSMVVCIGEYLADHKARVHSERSSGIPSLAVSTPDE